MSEPKPFASLSSGLLARKGGAKPAMRPQGFGQMGMGMEDLGWNDMGYAPPAPAPAFADYQEELPERVPSKISALTPAPRPGEESEEALEAELEEDLPPPAVVEQQRAIEARFAPPEDIEEAAEPIQVPLRKPKVSRRIEKDSKPAEVVTLPARPRQKAGAKGKAAFTLRLDAERHLKLRLACAVTHRSAQQIVSEALDEFLDALPELDALAGQVPTKLGKLS
jgi:hypothetical protein